MPDAGDFAGMEVEREKVRAGVRSIVNRLAPEPGACEGGTRLVEDLAYDSLALLELAFAVEEAFALKPMDVLSASMIRTVGDLESYVLRELRLA